MAAPQWVKDILAEYSNGEVQAGKTYTRYRRTERRPSEPGEQDTKIIAADKKVKGTRIPASTINHIRNNLDTVKLSKKTVDKLWAFAKRQRYSTLRSAGVLKDQAKAYSRKKTFPVIDITDKKKITSIPELPEYYLKIAKGIIAGKKKDLGVDIPLEAMLYGLGRSIHGAGYWDVYVKTRKWNELHAKRQRAARPEPEPFPEPIPEPKAKRRRKPKSRRRIGKKR